MLAELQPTRSSPQVPLAAAARASPVLPRPCHLCVPVPDGQWELVQQARGDPAVGQSPGCTVGCAGASVVCQQLWGERQRHLTSPETSAGL